MDLNDPRAVRRFIADLIETHTLGVLATIDLDGRPHLRWMAAITDPTVHRLYTLTGAETRKIEHVRGNPHVSWIFSTPTHSDVVTLDGQARVAEEPLAEALWDRLIEHARPFGSVPLRDTTNREYWVIETTVARCELLSPRLKLFHPVEIPSIE